MGLRHSSVVDAPLGEVFAWHARPGAITRLMPAWPPVSAVAPHLMRNAEYTATLPGLLHRPALVPPPGFGPRLLLGTEGAREIAKAIQYVRPHRPINARHHFRHPELEAALRHVLGHEPTGCMSRACG